MNTCINCSSDTKNPKFCSKSCAAKHNNKQKPKRKAKIRHCSKCNIILNPDGKACRKTVCQNCNKNYVDWNSVTLNDLRSLRQYQKHSRIRNVARSNYRRSNKPKHCIVCGYDKHYEVCHIKPINEFHPDTPVSEINDLKNLIALCPNHHWELDYGDLDVNKLPL